MLNNEDSSSLQWTVDETAYFDLIRHVFQHVAPDVSFSWKQVLIPQTTQLALFAENH